jgi:hypothetical protein
MDQHSEKLSLPARAMVAFWSCVLLWAIVAAIVVVLVG